jgi:hypothetical protein
MSFMPEVKMDFIPDDMSDDESTTIDEFNEDKDKTQEEIEEANIENDIDEAEIPKKVPKAKSKRDDMNVNEIFNMPDAVPPPNVKLTKKGKPRKQRPPMSEEHKKKLALAREKAMAARKKKAQEKKEAKELEKEEKELLKKQKVKRVKQLKEEVEEDNNKIPVDLIDPEKLFSAITKKDLEEAQLEAIMKYETIRKQRKKEKQEKQKKDAEEEAIRQQLRRAVAPPQEYNPFSGCY